MNPIQEHYLSLTRRRFFGRAASSIGAGLGALSLGSLLGGSSAFGAQEPALAQGPHFAPKAKRVIYLHMEGGPSHLDLYDYKPELRRRFNQDLPDSIRKGQRLTTMTSGQTRFPVAPSMFRFQRAENRTRINGFAGRCVNHSATSPSAPRTGHCPDAIGRGAGLPRAQARRTAWKMVRVPLESRSRDFTSNRSPRRRSNSSSVKSSWMPARLLTSSLRTIGSSA